MDGFAGGGVIMALTLAKKIDKQPKPQPERINYDWATYLKEEAKEKLAAMQSFTFRSFNYVWDEEDELYYHFYEIEVWKKNKIGVKPHGYTSKQFASLCKKEKEYKRLEAMANG